MNHVKSQKGKDGWWLWMEFDPGKNSQSKAILWESLDAFKNKFTNFLLWGIILRSPLAGHVIGKDELSSGPVRKETPGCFLPSKCVNYGTFSDCITSCPFSEKPSTAKWQALLSFPGICSNLCYLVAYSSSSSSDWSVLEDWGHLWFCS